MIQLLLAVIYISFISLGLPDSLLGSVWPTMYKDFDVPISYAGIISMIIALGTVVSSLQSDRLTRKLGTGKVTAISVGMTAVALFGFSVSNSFVSLCLWAIPYGLGAGSVDASLNNYVALNYKSRHMSWLHCMWGVGAAVGPYIMAYALTGAEGWPAGYRYIAIFQIVLTAILIFSLPLWKKRVEENVSDDIKALDKPLTLRQIIKIPGAKEVMATFFCYCAIEQIANIWASTYLVLHKGFSADKAASFASLFFIGITVGRALSGFLTIRFNDVQMVRLGQIVMVIGAVTLMLPLGEYALIAGLVLIGLGGAPIYPCIIHATPENFGADKSQAIIGVQMASAYMGTCLMPPVFGLVAEINAIVFPMALLLGLVIMFFMHERMQKKCRKN